VANFQVRAFLQLSNEIVPTNEIQRIIYYESGGNGPEIGKNIYDDLTVIDKKRIDEIIGMIGTSGIRGTMEIEQKNNEINNP